MSIKYYDDARYNKQRKSIIHDLAHVIWWYKKKYFICLKGKV